MREKDQVIEEKKRIERQLGRVNQQLEESERVMAQFQRRISELEQLRPATDATPRSS
jgi:phage shock protein A